MQLNFREISMYVKTLYHNRSFWVKYILSIIIVTTILAAINTELLFYKVWLYSSISFLLLIIISSPAMLKILKIALCLYNIKHKSLEENFKILAEKMGADFATYVPVKNYNSALVFFFNKYLVIGETLKLKLSKGELEALLAHEFSHKIRRSYHNKILCVGLIFSLLLFFIALGHVYMRRVMIPALVYFLSPFFWRIELDCYETAIKYCNKVDFIKALSIVYEERLDAFSFNHPSANYRIRNLNRAN